MRVGDGESAGCPFWQGILKIIHIHVLKQLGEGGGSEKWAYRQTEQLCPWLKNPDEGALNESHSIWSSLLFSFNPPTSHPLIQNTPRTIKNVTCIGFVESIELKKKQQCYLLELRYLLGADTIVGESWPHAPAEVDEPVRVTAAIVPGHAQGNLPRRLLPALCSMTQFKPSSMGCSTHILFIY
jgi:hypothetical protein